MTFSEKFESEEKGTVLSWKQFVADVVKAIAWPIVVLFVVLLLRGQLDRVIGTTDKVSYGGFEISFSQTVGQIKKEIDQSIPPVEKDPSKIKFLNITASLSPSAAVMEAWKEVEVATIKLILKRNPNLVLDSDTPYKHLEILLAEYDIADVRQIKIFHDLRVLRNKVVHVSQYDITSEQAIEYVGLALSLAEYFSVQ